MATKNAEKYGVYPSQSTAIRARICGLELFPFLPDKRGKAIFISKKVNDYSLRATLLTKCFNYTDPAQPEQTTFLGE